MTALKFRQFPGKQVGLVTPDAYNTAWVALVPDINDPTRPAWPQALQYLRNTQLPDGGWGTAHVYYAHGRTISTLAALWALLAWGSPADKHLIEAGVQALHRYGADLGKEPYEPIGFELLLPRLVSELWCYGLDLPFDAWAHINGLASQKMDLIGSLTPDYNEPRSWWFNLEILSESQLAEIDDRILNLHGSVGTSPAATAAYLRAKRLHGQDSNAASAFLAQVLYQSRGGAGVCYPIELFELMWTLDAFRRAGMSPSHSRLVPLITQLAQVWDKSPKGLSWSVGFPLADGDDTAVAYTVLAWAGLKPDDKALRSFWGPDCYLSFSDELGIPVSANVHGLAALRQNVRNQAHQEMATKIAFWLRKQIAEKGELHDKWHLSPLYATSRAISALVGLDDHLAQHCVNFVLSKQDKNGGWGTVGHTNLEETSYAILGLVEAHRAGLLKDTTPLRRADAYLVKHSAARPVEPLWIGKSLYQPIGVAGGLLNAAKLALSKQSIAYDRQALWQKQPFGYAAKAQQIFRQ